MTVKGPQPTRAGATLTGSSAPSDILLGRRTLWANLTTQVFTPSPAVHRLHHVNTVQQAGQNLPWR